MLRRSVEGGKIRRSVRWLQRPARFVDRWSGPRQTWLVRGAGLYVIAVACILVAAVLPMMELVPFSANLAGLAITAFGLAMIAEDGVIALVAIGLCAVAGVVIAYAVF